jgi:catechol 2,3-dioxygenase-like lactoylglutathione lyase family enzyme
MPYRLRYNILAKDIPTSVAFYRDLLGLDVVDRDSWFVTLARPGDEAFALDIVDQVSEFVPRAARGIAAGSYLSLLTEDVAAAVAIARAHDVEIIEETPGTAGRAVIRDPNGIVIDIATEFGFVAMPPRDAVG